MPLFETERGTRLEIKLPTTEWPEFEEARDAYEDLKKERRVTATRLTGLRGERGRAIAKDREALADSIRDGKPDPGDKAVEKIEKEIAACNRRLEALEVALDDAEDDLLAVVDEGRDGWAKEVEEELETAREEYAREVEALASSRARMSAKYALLRWVRLFPEEEMSYRVRSSYVTKLPAPHGSPYALDEVVQALREDAQMQLEVAPTVTDTQRLHEERRANEEAGRGFFTDSELGRLNQNPREFFGGQGARVVRPLRMS